MKFENRYGLLDRVLHDIAFRAGRAQQAMADVEEILFGEEFRAIPVDDPVFISALPRSGTTILLQILWETGCFATHTYRDMPFVLCPMLWNRFSRRFIVSDVVRERAHGDGLMISAESPEAFEEMIWKHFWPDHYLDDRIRPWTESDHHEDFEAFFESHMRKVVAIRRDDPSTTLRYLSKNNLNIARLAAPPRPLRRGIVLVPFREPLQHAASMLRQHRRFSEIHREDDFLRRYMEAIGHHEFGEGLRPVDFGGWLPEAADPAGLEFWIRYWIAAYRHVLRHLGSFTVLLSYARLTEAPEDCLRALARPLGLDRGDLVSQADALRRPRTHPVNRAEITPSLAAEASAVYERLEEHALPDGVA